MFSMRMYHVCLMPGADRRGCWVLWNCSYGWWWTTRSAVNLCAGNQTGVLWKSSKGFFFLLRCVCVHLTICPSCSVPFHLWRPEESDRCFGARVTSGYETRWVGGGTWAQVLGKALTVLNPWGIFPAMFLFEYNFLLSFIFYLDGVLYSSGCFISKGGTELVGLLPPAEGWEYRLELP